MFFLTALFYMHRGFFARAMQECPDDPLGSKYAPSVLAAYTSACSYVGLIESLYSQYPALMERTWHLFTHVFSCAVSPQGVHCQIDILIMLMIGGLCYLRLF
jgi:hypothetical protein